MSWRQVIEWSRPCALQPWFCFVRRQTRPESITSDSGKDDGINVKGQEIRSRSLGERGVRSRLTAQVGEWRTNTRDRGPDPRPRD